MGPQARHILEAHTYVPACRFSLRIAVLRLPILALFQETLPKHTQGITSRSACVLNTAIMAPKKKQQTQTLSLGAFLNEDKFGGSWADEVEESYGSQPLPAPTHERRTGYSSYGGGGGFGDRGAGAYAPRDSFPTELPTRPPYTAHLGNLSYEATQEAVTDFFADCAITSVRIIEDRIENRPKGFAYAEFADVEGLKKALDLDGEQFQGRNIRVRIADPPKGGEFRDGPSARDLGSWERKGPLADIPGRGNDRRMNDFGERRGPPRDGPSDEGRSRDFGNWERKGPLSPAITPEAGDDSRDNSRPRGSDRGESFRNNRTATWGEGRSDGSRPPAREFRERPERAERPERPERAPTAAEMDNQWRSNMKPDQTSASGSRDGSQAPMSPGGPESAAPAARPRLNLQKRTVTEAPADASSSAGGDAKASPFGAARPIDTAAKEKEIAEKREQTAKEQKEAEEKAKEERRLAKEAAAKEAEEKAAADAKEAEEKAAEKDAAAAAAAEVKAEEKVESETQKIPVRPKEDAEAPKSRAAGSGSWRSSGDQPRPARGGGYVPRGRGDGTRGRGGAPRGGAPRSFEGRPPRANGSAPAAGAQDVPPSPAAASESEAAPAQDPEGWTTVPAKGRRK
ncbi:uncharacterized protein B0I36DRAFT_359463 [Microdochium trichocladiopsis]|uniref:RRM domain-containing protein n=1 Tax=Microdochium trichocladiopsis TaxID=1682393 RepID=A0A9P8YH30_9PEZI|nr:uncharacterized protein B0I36DRAFT_359463 [Microdochium trichocladiopsis]KAH7037823.1 hypothetical protein B0I36DRAFT_359463 [Microdochium trichocladiopsis]